MKYIYIMFISSFLINIGYSAANYDLKVINNTGYYMYYYSSRSHCVKGGFGSTISPNSSGVSTFEDDNGAGSCGDTRKHVDINFRLFHATQKWFEKTSGMRISIKLDGENRSYPANQFCALGYPLPNNLSYLSGDCGPVEDYKTTIEWNHKKENHWKSMFETSNYEGDHNLDNDGYLIVTKAACGGKDCLDKYSDGGSNLELTLGYNSSKGREVLPGYYKIATVGVGKVYVTSDYNRQVKENDSGEVYLDPENNIYTFHFTNIAQGCTLANGQFQCPQVIDATIPYFTGENTVLFVCQQSSSSQSKCPWVLADNDASNYIVNYS
ncbi:hypothetical protein L3V83_11815 [Thiotrichales bacterium 19X7-9]|nr:hypothetical protein [Thiotrichales bacterium 19X7-9]